MKGNNHERKIETHPYEKQSEWNEKKKQIEGFSRMCPRREKEHALEGGGLRQKLKWMQTNSLSYNQVILESECCNMAIYSVLKASEHWHCTNHSQVIKSSEWENYAKLLSN